MKSAWSRAFLSGSSGQVSVRVYVHPFAHLITEWAFVWSALHWIKQLSSWVEQCSPHQSELQLTRFKSKLDILIILDLTFIKLNDEIFR